MKGWWSGPILRTSPIDAQFGPPTVTLANGRVVSNPLATTRRFAFPTRAEGQFSLPARHYLNVRVGRELRLHGSTRLQLHVDVFNLPNLASFQGFQPGAQQVDDPTVREGRERATAAHRAGRRAILVLTAHGAAPFTLRGRASPAAATPGPSASPSSPFRATRPAQLRFLPRSGRQSIGVR